MTGTGREQGKNQLRKFCGNYYTVVETATSGGGGDGGGGERADGYISAVQWRVL